MKKQLLILCGTLICLCSNANPSKVYYDKQNANGVRTIVMENFNIYCTATTAAAMWLGADVTDDNGTKKVFYFIRCDYNEFENMCFEVGNKLLLKMENGEIMELSAIQEYKWWEYHSDAIHPYTLYAVTQQQLATLIAHNVIKIRVQYKDDTFDREIKGGKLSKGLSKSVPILHSLVKQGVKDVHDDF